jgi:two-component system, chemotaxis family, CheB/CheR fusion protein
MTQTTETTEPDALRALLDHLKQARGFDFSGYKRGSLERRIAKRMHEVGVADYGEYLDHLQANPSEFTDLFNTILINVTGFFRDATAWEYVADTVVPKLLEEIPDNEPLRIWSAACASGEEAYTAAMVLAEKLGEDAFTRRVKIYATDVDEVALSQARAGTYSNDQLKAVPPELVERYFEETPAGRTFRADLRRSVIFGRNDLVQDAPISRIDLLISRNALMYFTAETQARILAHFNFALKETGFLFLGKSEMLITHADLFTPVNVRARVFRKVVGDNLRERLAFVTSDVTAAANGDADGRLRRDSVDVSPVAQIVVDRDEVVTVANQRARALFDLTARDVGRPLRDLDVSYRPLDLRSALRDAFSTREPVRLGWTRWTPRNGAERVLEVTVTPVDGAKGEPLGAGIHFEDVTDFARLDTEHARQKRELEAAHEELQSTVEELETTNEELHSTNEELETTNEELQSTNEELETMNEELQSTNDELETMNDEQRERALELDRVNMFLEGILSNLGVSVVVVDHQQQVQVWNASSSDLWGLREDEVQGKRFLDLDIGLPVEELRGPIESALAASPRNREVKLAATERRGRPIELTVRTMPLRDPRGGHFGALLLMTPSTSPAA